MEILKKRSAKTEYAQGVNCHTCSKINLRDCVLRPRPRSCPPGSCRGEQKLPSDGTRRCRRISPSRPSRNLKIHSFRFHFSCFESEYTGVSISVQEGVSKLVRTGIESSRLFWIPRQPRYRYYWDLDIRTRSRYPYKVRVSETVLVWIPRPKCI